MQQREKKRQPNLTNIDLTVSSQVSWLVLYSSFTDFHPKMLE